VKALLILLALAGSPAHADLYRWIDRETGSVKFSNTPPPWYGDPERERSSPAVEVIRPSKPVARQESAKPAISAIAMLEARWTELTKFFGSLPPTTDFSRAGAGLRQHMEAYTAVSAELDRLDPVGAQRRRAQQPATLEDLRRGLEAQFSPNPPSR